MRFIDRYYKGHPEELRVGKEKKIRRMANMIMGMQDVYLRPGIGERRGTG